MFCGVDLHLQPRNHRLVQWRQRLLIRRRVIGCRKVRSDHEQLMLNASKFFNKIHIRHDASQAVCGFVGRDVRSCRTRNA